MTPMEFTTRAGGATADPHADDTRRLQLIELRRDYGSTVALDGLSFSVEVGQMMGFVGPNGAGKTTAMRIVLGVLEPNSGEVRWNGRPIDRAARSRFGYMPEERGLYPKMKVRDQLVYFARLHGVSTADAQASADGLINKLGLEERAGDRVEALSLLRTIGKGQLRARKSKRKAP